jgi:hypothetical protein
MRNSIPNPTKSFSVNFSHEDVKKAMSNLQIYLGMADAPGYQIDHFDEAIGELRLRKTEFLSLGVVIVINANFVNETTTNISIEVQRVFGTFDQMHEVTLANRHLNLMTQTLSSLLQNPSMDVNHNSFLILKKSNEKGLTIFGLLGWIFFWYIKLPIWIIKHKTMTPKKKVIWLGVVGLAFLFMLHNINKGFEEKAFEKEKRAIFYEKISPYWEDTDSELYRSVHNPTYKSVEITPSYLDEIGREGCVKMCDSLVEVTSYNDNGDEVVTGKTTYMCAAEKEILLSYYDLTEKDVKEYLKTKK